MSSTRTPPSRLEAAGPYADLARLLSEARPVPPLDGLAVVRVERRLRASAGNASVRPRARRVPAFATLIVLVLGGGVVATGATVAGGRGWSWRRLVSALPWSAAHTAKSLPPKHARLAGTRAVLSTSETTAGLEPAPEAAPPTVVIAEAPIAVPGGLDPPPIPRTPSRPLRGASSGPRAIERSDETARSEEVRLFARAVTSLRREDKATDAIALCDEFLRRFPTGALVEEVEALRAEGELRAGDHGAALAGLGRLALGDDERSVALRLARAELRAETSCAAALADFDHVLATRPSAAIAERALYGRSACRARTGDHAGAANDARAYLGRFPEGPRASRLRERAGL